MQILNFYYKNDSKMTFLFISPYGICHIKSFLFCCHLKHACQEGFETKKNVFFQFFSSKFKWCIRSWKQILLTRKTVFTASYTSQKQKCYTRKIIMWDLFFVFPISTRHYFYFVKIIFVLFIASIFWSKLMKTV